MVFVVIQQPLVCVLIEPHFQVQILMHYWGDLIADELRPSSCFSPYSVHIYMALFGKNSG
jgi:hypothetical protein